MSAALIIPLVILSSFQFVQASYANGSTLRSTLLHEDSVLSQVYIPIIQKPPLNLPLINIPYFEGSDINYHEAAVSWFGQVRGNENYADIRVGYNSDEIYFRVSVFDRFLWEDATPDIHNLTKWDSITLYLDIAGNDGNELSPTIYQFTRQLQWWDDGFNRQIAYQGSSSGWNEVPLTFYTNYDWRGNAPDDDVEDRGYVIIFHIPFDSLGLNVPTDGTKWGASITMHDRDNADGTIYSETHWPQNPDLSRSSTWSQLSFGLPTYTPPQVVNPQTFTIRNGLNGAVVKDGVVGGNTMCGAGLNFFEEWGDHSYPLIGYMNVQNQGDVADWPCFSKYYITFPLDSLPINQTVVSATLTLHQLGQSTGWPNEPTLKSLIQIMLIDQDWYENILTWNNVPIPIENVSQSWVYHLPDEVQERAYTWDLSRAVARAYEEREPLRLVVYSADAFGPIGKYFFSSDQEWEIVRPSLTVELVEP
jgi:hypothetical protein